MIFWILNFVPSRKPSLPLILRRGGVRGYVAVKVATRVTAMSSSEDLIRIWKHGSDFYGNVSDVIPAEVQRNEKVTSHSENISYLPSTLLGFDFLEILPID